MENKVEAAGDLTTADGVVIRIEPADLPHALVDLRKEVIRVVLGGARSVVVDVSRVDCLSSVLITALPWANRRCRARGGSVVVRNPTPRSLDLLVRTGLWDILDVELGPAPQVAR